MAEKNSYIREAYDTLPEISADERKRLEYQAREKAIRDTQAAFSYARKEGKAEGIEIGEARGEARWKAKTVQIIKQLHLMGMPNEEIAVACDLPIDEVEQVVDEVEQN